MQPYKTAFTLIELLTVIAIIGILATLMLTGVSSAKKASNRARCASNLHQISLALNMYIDDFEKRSPDLGRLSRYLGNRQALLCPSDKTSGWGNLVNPNPLIFDASFTANLGSDRAPSLASEVIPFSYLNPLGWENWAWDRLSKLGSHAGLATCQLHGLGRPDPDQPSFRDYQGVILRAQRDGAVVKREIYWNTAMADNSPPKFASGVAPTTDASASVYDSSFDYPWLLFSDDPNP
jgi:prepilin-type N-terminal cleavage/methylation domain-containing protein